MKRVSTMTSLFLFALLLFPVLFSCQEIVDEDPLLGTWSNPAWDEQWTITENSITYASYNLFYTAEIVKRVDGSFNGTDTTLISGGAVPESDYGYCVIRYTTVDGPGTGTVGKYNVFRWQFAPGDTDTAGFVQGYLGVGAYPDNVNQVFETDNQAETGATNTAGYFTYASTGIERQ